MWNKIGKCYRSNSAFWNCSLFICLKVCMTERVIFPSIKMGKIIYIRKNIPRLLYTGHVMECQGSKFNWKISSFFSNINENWIYLFRILCCIFKSFLSLTLKSFYFKNWTVKNYDKGFVLQLLFKHYIKNFICIKTSKFVYYSKNEKLA